MPKKLTDEERESRKIYNTANRAIRKAFCYWPSRKECLENAKRLYQGRNKRQKYEYHCNKCNNWFKRDDVQVDHIIPCGSFLKPEHHKPFIIKMFLGELQVLCRDCHQIKCNIERENGEWDNG